MNEGVPFHGMEPLVEQKGQEEHGDEEADSQEVEYVQPLHADFNKVIARGPGDNDGGEKDGCTFFAHEYLFLLMVDGHVSGEKIENDIARHKDNCKQGGIEKGRLGHDADADE